MADTSNVTEIKYKSDTQDGSISKMKDVYDAVIQQLFEELKKVYEEIGKVSDEVLLALNCVFQTPLLPALDLIDNRSVTLLVSPSGRNLYQVIGSSGNPYTHFTSSHYCSCPAYRYTVLMKEEHLMCKHVLAAKLSDAIGRTKVINVTDQEVTNIITNME